MDPYLVSADPDPAVFLHADPDPDPAFAQHFSSFFLQFFPPGSISTIQEGK